jgi:hypothetical protein
MDFSIYLTITRFLLRWVLFDQSGLVVMDFACTVLHHAVCNDRGGDLGIKIAHSTERTGGTNESTPSEFYVILYSTSPYHIVRF